MQNNCHELLTVYEKCIQSEEERSLRRPRRMLYGITILKWILKKKDVDWIHLIPQRDQWRTLANTMMNVRFHKWQGNF